ncbi:hypothetical protein PROSTU_01772 [Providencia stuartii ATCC 25827]|uniref:Uncharacterized protein n=1 Tax=Providencia stuartii ATCC 25827 TaxID=471874 RepID=A0AA86YHL7_PROST|nr:hypothetical protein PROSTU_01772 [Providencia stuartii ATCC 25827]
MKPCPNLLGHGYFCDFIELVFCYLKRKNASHNLLRGVLLL